MMPIMEKLFVGGEITTNSAGSFNFNWSSPTLSDVKSFGQGANGSNNYCYIDTSENFRCSGSSYYGGWSIIGNYHAASSFGIDSLNGQTLTSMSRNDNTACVTTSLESSIAGAKIHMKG